MKYKITSPGLQSFIVESDVPMKDLIKQMQAGEKQFFLFNLAEGHVYIGIDLLKFPLIQEVQVGDRV
jgi:hypothetical protein